MTTLTVDIFDTVLLRDVWPEELQFEEVAKAWLPLFAAEIDATITSFELTSFRTYSRRLLWDAGREETSRPENKGRDAEVTIEAWFRSLVELVAEKYSIVLQPDHVNRFVQRLIDIELRIELEHLLPNKPLLASLARLKENRGFRVYYVSDMYLSSDHVTFMLGKLGIDVFDGGVTSADVSRGKGTTNLYKYLNETDCFPEFSTTTNIHIGDNEHSDYRSAIAEGSQAIFYKTRHHLARRVKTVRGSRLLERQRRENLQDIRAQFSRSFSHSVETVRIGSLFGAAAVFFLSGVVSRARLLPDTRFVAVSSEATAFARLLTALRVTLPENLSFEPAINRKSVLRALVRTVMDFEGKYSHSLRNIMRFSEGRQGATELLRFLGDTSTDLLAANMSPDEYADFMWSRLALLRAEALPKIALPEDDPLSRLGLDQGGRLKLVDLGWGGSIQVFLRELASLQGSTAIIEGLYLAARPDVNPFGVDRGLMNGVVFENIDAQATRDFFVPEIWEYVLSEKAELLASGRHQSLQVGLIAAVGLWKSTIHCSPEDFWLAMKPALRKLLTHPTSNEVEILGSISWEAGFTDVWNYSLVDLSRDKLRMHLKSFIYPKRALSDMANLPPNAWKRGFISYYRLGHLVPVLKYFGRKRGVIYI